MIKELINLANELDGRGLAKEADYLDSLVSNAQDWTWGDAAATQRVGQPGLGGYRGDRGSAADTMRRREMKRELQETVDWFDAEVFSRMESGWDQPIVTTKLLRIDGAGFIPANTTFTSSETRFMEQRGKEESSGMWNWYRNKVRSVISSGITLRQTYKILENFVIRNPDLGVLMQSYPE